VYAPHSGKPVNERREFFSDLGSLLNQLSSHGPNFFMGDFNARLHHKFPEEESMIGPYMFGNPLASHNPDSNRSLLVELCSAHDFVIGKTLFDEPPERQITCYNIGSNVNALPTPSNFGQIDFVLVPRAWANQLNGVYSDRSYALATHHFLVVAHLGLHVAKPISAPRKPRLHYAALRDPGLADRFANTFKLLAEDFDDDPDLNQFNDTFNSALKASAHQVLPTVRYRYSRSSSQKHPKATRRGQMA
jgi:hypothetical protein